MIKEEKEANKHKARGKDVQKQLNQLPQPPGEHTHELKMEQRLKELLLQGTKKKLSNGEMQFYSRQIMLDEIGYQGQLRLKEARACIVGLGGLGCTIATQLAAMGVGHLRLVDRDVVEESNLQRQHLYSFDFIGFPKVEAAVERLKRLNPYVEFERFPLSLGEKNAAEILEGMDVIVDGLDNMNTRYVINRACVKLGIPYVFGAAISTYGNVSTVVPGETACLECFYGNLKDSSLQSCATIGVHPAVLGVVASIEAAETIKILLGSQPSLRNKLLYCDVGFMRFEEIEVSKAENCSVCGVESKTNPTPLKSALVEEGCGRKGRRAFIVTPKEDLNLKMEKLVVSMKSEGAQLKVKTELGITLETKQGTRISILKSGIMIVEGTSSKRETLDLYEKIIVGKGKISKAKIGFATSWKTSNS